MDHSIISIIHLVQL